MCHIQTWKLCYTGRHHLLLQSIALGFRKQFISGLLQRTVIDITQLGCPHLADIRLPASAVLLHVTTSLNMFVHCGQPTRYLSGSTFTFYVCSMQCALLSLHSINVFQMAALGLLRRTYYLNEQQTKYVSIYLNDDRLKPEVKFGTPGHAV